MTIEESKSMWKLELEHMKPIEHMMSKELKKLYKLVGEKIESGELLYSTFTTDTMDLLTKAVTEGKEDDDRHAIVQVLTNSLIEKYEAGNFEPLNVEHHDSDSAE